MDNNISQSANVRKGEESNPVVLNNDTYEKVIAFLDKLEELIDFELAM